jgi:asparagine synthase (glutamine-hydrolysing)
VGDADETSYQESVVRRLGLSEWARIHPADSLDILGDLSSRLTQRHGLLYPGNIHFLVPMLDIVRGGALLTGLGGDEVLEGHGNHALAAMMTAQQRPSRRTVRSLAKRYVLRGRQRDRSREAMDGYFSWLVPQARRLVIERMVESLMSDSLWADRQLTTITYRMRYLHRARTDLSRVAADFGVDVTHPLLGAEFVGAVADRYGRVGFSSRTESMEQLFGDLLPDDVIRRTSKAVFDEVFWTDTAAERVRELSLSPVAEYVDEEALRRHWRSDEPKGNTFLLAKYLADVATPTDGSDAQSSADDRRG